MSDHNKIIVPFLKWAGGKRWLVKNYPHVFPKSFKRYLEPFLGSGAVFFALKPNCSILSDVNAELINVYQAVKTRPDLVQRYLVLHHSRHSKQYYYEMRDLRPRSQYAQAARTIYLNRTCWNALYRVNKKGTFNVPIGTKTNVILPTDNFSAASNALKNSTIMSADFEEIILLSKKGDFIFLDPPYTVKHKYNGFVKYNENLFSWADQVKLRDCVENAVTRGVKVLITNADHKSTRELYSDFLIRTLKRKSVIACKSNARGIYDELLIRCW